MSAISLVRRDRLRARAERLARSLYMLLFALALFVVAFAGLPPFAARAADDPNTVEGSIPGDWQDYVNPTFGSAFSYPADVFGFVGEREDGGEFASADKEAVIKAGGVMVDPSVSLDDVMRQMLLSPTFDTVTSMQRISETAFRMDGVKDDRNAIHIVRLPGDGRMSVFSARFTDRYAELVLQIAETYHIAEPAAEEAASGGGAGSAELELAFWDTIKDSTDPADFEAYLGEFPDGAFAALARIRIARLNASTPSPAPTPVQPEAPVAAPPPPQPAGLYATPWGEMLFAPRPDGTIWAKYEGGESHIDGVMNGTTLVGTWHEPASPKKCADGGYWGHIRLAFTADMGSFNGAWGYCEDPLERGVAGERTSMGDTAEAQPPMPLPQDSPSIVPPPVDPAAVYKTPGRGSAERQAIMDAARTPVAPDIGQQVLFVVDVLNSDGHWAYLQATPVQLDGTPLDWTQTNFAEDWQMDAMSDVIMVLLAKPADEWQVIDYVIGPTDVAWYEWLDRFGLPERLFTE